MNTIDRPVSPSEMASPSESTWLLSRTTVQKIERVTQILGLISLILTIALTIFIVVWNMTEARIEWAVVFVAFLFTLVCFIMLASAAAMKEHQFFLVPYVAVLCAWVSFILVLVAGVKGGDRYFRHSKIGIFFYAVAIELAYFCRVHAQKVPLAFKILAELAMAGFLLTSLVWLVTEHAPKRWPGILFSQLYFLLALTGCIFFRSCSPPSRIQAEETGIQLEEVDIEHTREPAVG